MLVAFHKIKFRFVKAFTLIEVMVAMLVLAIGLLGLAGITVVVLRSNTLSQQISDATNIATDLMEALKRQPVSVLANYSSGANSCATFFAPPPVGDCPLLDGSGLSGMGEYYPAKTGNGGRGPNSCGVSGLLKFPAAGTDAATFDTVLSTLGGGGSAFAANETVCGQGNRSFAQREYLRYYRITQVGTEYRLYVVVLWRDKFGKWRNIHLTTTRAS